MKVHLQRSGRLLGIIFFAITSLVHLPAMAAGPEAKEAALAALAQNKAVGAEIVGMFERNNRLDLVEKIPSLSAKERGKLIEYVARGKAEGVEEKKLTRGTSALIRAYLDAGKVDEFLRNYSKYEANGTNFDNIPNSYKLLEAAIERVPSAKPLFEEEFRFYAQWAPKAEELRKMLGKKIEAEYAASQSKNPYRSSGLEKFNAEKYEEALDDFKKALETEPTNPVNKQNLASAWRMIGIKHFNADQYDKAVAAHSRAIEVEPGNVKHWISRGLSSSKLKQYSAASRDYSKAIEIDPKNAKAYVLRGVLKESEPSNNLKAALIDYAKAREANADEAAKELAQQRSAISDNTPQGQLNAIYKKAYAMVREGIDKSLAGKQKTTLTEPLLKALDVQMAGVAKLDPQRTLLEHHLGDKVFDEVWAHALMDAYTMTKKYTACVDENAAIEDEKAAVKLMIEAAYWVRLISPEYAKEKKFDFAKTFEEDIKKHQKNINILQENITICRRNEEIRAENARMRAEYERRSAEIYAMQAQIDQLFSSSGSRSSYSSRSSSSSGGYASSSAWGRTCRSSNSSRGGVTVVTTTCF